jgi:flagellar motor switch protein FliM
VSERLSQDEIQALLRGLADGEAGGPDEGPAPGDVRPYEMVGEARFAGRRFPALELALERFTQRLGRSLAALLGARPEIGPATTETLAFATFRNRLAAPAAVHLFTMAPLKGRALLVVSPPLAFALIDRLFGGPGRVPADGRQASPIEAQILRRVVVQALADLAGALAPLQPLTCELAGVEWNPAALGAIGAREVLLVASVPCDLGGGPLPLTVAVPFAMLEPLRAKLGEPAPAPVEPDGQWRAAIAAAIEAAEVTLSAELGARELPAGEILRLRVGDVLALGTASDDPLALRVEGVPLLRGAPGVSRGNNAVRVLGRETREGA